MSVVHYSVSWFIRIILAVLCKIDAGEIKRLPKSGPFILVTNHINFLEVPLLYTRLMPRKLATLVKAETWKNPFFAFLGNLWHAIPINRGSVDRNAVSAALEALSIGEILVIAPEGTRSGDGKLRAGFPGIVLFAVNSGIPIFPLAHFGGERFWKNFRHLKRTAFSVRVGKPFTVGTAHKSLSREERRSVTDEIMRRIAELLPDEQKGYYSGFEKEEYNYIRMV